MDMSNDIKYGSFAIKRKETQKKINFIFICQKCFKCYNLFRFYINLFFIFFGVSSLSIAKLSYIIYPKCPRHYRSLSKDLNCQTVLFKDMSLSYANTG